MSRLFYTFKEVDYFLRYLGKTSEEKAQVVPMWILILLFNELHKRRRYILHMVIGLYFYCFYFITFDWVNQLLLLF